jgi:hypothetical protein
VRARLYRVFIAEFRAIVAEMAARTDGLFVAIDALAESAPAKAQAGRA